LGLVTKRTNNHVGTVNTEYDLFGNSIKIYSETESKNLVYDDFGELINETQNYVTNSYAYDNDGYEYA